MSPPIRDGSGSSIGSIRLGDGSEISEVRTGAGDVLFSGIPDSAIARYEFEGNLSDSLTNGKSDFSGTATSIDGTFPDFTTNAVIGNQAITTDSSNNEAVNLPNYPSSFFDSGSFSIRVDSETDGYVFSFGTNSNGEMRAIRADNGTYEFIGFSSDFNTGVAPASGYEMLTVTWDVSNNSATVYTDDANQIGSSTNLTLNSPQSQQNSIAYRAAGSIAYHTMLADDARSYDKTLTSTEISNLFNNGSIQ